MYVYLWFHGITNKHYCRSIGFTSLSNCNIFWDSIVSYNCFKIVFPMRFSNSSSSYRKLKLLIVMPCRNYSDRKLVRLTTDLLLFLRAFEIWANDCVPSPDLTPVAGCLCNCERSDQYKPSLLQRIITLREKVVVLSVRLGRAWVRGRRDV